MILFADTNIILDLLACDLLDDTLNALGVTIQEVFVYREEIVRTCIFNDDVRQGYPVQVLNAAMKFARDAQAINTAVDPEEHAYMTNADGIDSGEEIIFAATKGHKGEYRVATNDRNSLRSVCRADGCGAIEKRLNGRVLCLEHLLEVALAQVGPTEFAKRMKAGCARSNGFANVVPKGFADNAGGMTPILRERIEKLRGETKALLAP